MYGQQYVQHVFNCESHHDPFWNIVWWGFCLRGCATDKDFDVWILWRRVYFWNEMKEYIAKFSEHLFLREGWTNMHE